jgi:hypothetical protein
MGKFLDYVLNEMPHIGKPHAFDFEREYNKDWLYKVLDALNGKEITDRHGDILQLEDLKEKQIFVDWLKADPFFQMAFNKDFKKLPKNIQDELIKKLNYEYIINEAFDRYIEKRDGRHIPVYKNPTTTDYTEIQREDHYGNIRVGFDSEGNCWAWPAGLAMHQYMAFDLNQSSFKGVADIDAESDINYLFIQDKISVEDFKEKYKDRITVINYMLKVPVRIEISPTYQEMFGESYDSSIEYKGAVVPFYKNPYSGEIEDILKESEFDGVRIGVDKVGNIYAWDDSVVHEDVEKLKNIKFVLKLQFTKNNPSLIISTYNNRKDFEKYWTKQVAFRIKNMLPVYVKKVEWGSKPFETAHIFNEDFDQYVDVRNNHVPVWKNPNTTNLEEIVKEDEFKSVRFAMDKTGAIYAWPSTVLHDTMAYNLNKNWIVTGLVGKYNEVSVPEMLDLKIKTLLNNFIELLKSEFGRINISQI